MDYQHDAITMDTLDTNLDLKLDADYDQLLLEVHAYGCNDGWSSDDEDVSDIILSLDHFPKGKIA